MAKYAALLRGINLGKRTVKMDALRKLLEANGFTDVKTLLASGNVVFASKDSDAGKLRNKLEKIIEEEFGFAVSVVLRSDKEIATLVKADPFKGVKVDKDTRLYVTFMTNASGTKLNNDHKENGIHAISKDYIASVLRPGAGTPDHMDYLVKLFGANITTRNWNTVLKIHKALQG
jgi:uncharacterized protein (DUF1697 family)